MIKRNDNFTRHATFILFMLIFIRFTILIVRELLARCALSPAHSQRSTHKRHNNTIRFDPVRARCWSALARWLALRACCVHQYLCVYLFLLNLLDCQCAISIYIIMCERAQCNKGEIIDGVVLLSATPTLQVGSPYCSVVYLAWKQRARYLTLASAYHQSRSTIFIYLSVCPHPHAHWECAVFTTQLTLRAENLVQQGGLLIS